LCAAADDGIVVLVGTNPIAERADALLRDMLGPDARFRDGQLEAIAQTVEHRARTLLIQRTGWGKSLVYFIATRLLRDLRSGPTLLVSPLLSLMRNQIEMAARIAIRADRIDSENADEWEQVEDRLRRNEVDVLLVSPERLANERFLTRTLAQIPLGIGLLVVDEAHCISDWGHDFRPDYRRIVRIVRSLPASVPVIATTATANDRVAADVRAQLGEELRISRGPLTRDSLMLQTIELADQAERLAWLAEHLPELPGSGIVYCLTTVDCDRVAGWLRQNGIEAAAYHAQLPDGVSREDLERRLLRNEIKALVATVALGMGFDKPDLGFVIHYQRPGSLIAYYQQIGRAGRSVPQAYAVLLNGREDDAIQDYFIRSAFPDADTFRAVLDAVEASDSVSLDELQQAMNLRRGRLQQCLKLLEVDQAIVKQGARFFRTANPWVPDNERSDRVTAARRDELAAIREFVQSGTCLMQSVARSLDDPTATPCGRCAVCRGVLLPISAAPELTQAATVFLRRAFRPIEPRSMWARHDAIERRGRIPPDLRVAPGFALSLWGDAGWGRQVQQGKYTDGDFDEQLVEACVGLLTAEWRPDPGIAWVTSVPSLRRPDLVRGFARRLAAASNLPYIDALRQIRETAEQRTMENSTRQMANIAGAFEAIPGSVRDTPVLLVDDIVDSRWTFTECGYVLRQAGSGPVHPLALASTAGAGDTP
jgi:ATP-dependent DNA helicase RecQ